LLLLGLGILVEQISDQRRINGYIGEFWAAMEQTGRIFWCSGFILGRFVVQSNKTAPWITKRHWGKD
jgi:hypothetical protein